MFFAPFFFAFVSVPFFCTAAMILFLSAKSTDLVYQFSFAF